MITKRPRFFSLDHSGADNSPPQLWGRRYYRQEMWKHFQAHVDMTDSQERLALGSISHAYQQKTGQVLAAQRAGKLEAYDASLNDLMNQAEVETLGKIITVSSLADMRAMFWDLMGLYVRQHTPSELHTFIDPTQGYIRRIQTVVKAAMSPDLPADNVYTKYADKYRAILTQLYGADGDDHDILNLDPLAHLKWEKLHPLLAYRSSQNDLVESSKSAANLRNFARVYIEAGYPSEMLAYPMANEEDGNLRHLMLEGMEEPRPGDTKKAWQPLSYWLNFMLEKPSDVITPRTYYKRSPSFPEPVGAKVNESRREYAERSLLARRIAYGSFPLALRPIIPVMAERIVLQGAGIGLEELSKDFVDEEETSLFGEVVTEGPMDARRSFWSFMASQHNGWLRKGFLNQGSRLNHAPIAIAVEGLLRCKTNPTMVCRLTHLGRSGLSAPMAREEVEGNPEYRSLAWWAEYCNWSAPYMQRWLRAFHGEIDEIIAASEAPAAPVVEGPQTGMEA